jgi:hypothetical protein
VAVVQKGGFDRARDGTVLECGPLLPWHAWQGCEQRVKGMTSALTIVVPHINVERIIRVNENLGRRTVEVRVPCCMRTHFNCERTAPSSAGTPSFLACMQPCACMQSASLWVPQIGSTRLHSRFKSAGMQQVARALTLVLGHIDGALEGCAAQRVVFVRRPVTSRVDVCPVGRLWFQGRWAFSVPTGRRSSDSGLSLFLAYLAHSQTQQLCAGAGRTCARCCVASTCLVLLAMCISCMPPPQSMAHPSARAVGDEHLLRHDCAQRSYAAEQQCRRKRNAAAAAIFTS